MAKILLIFAILFVAQLTASPHKRRENSNEDDEEYYYDDYDPNDDGDDYEGSEELEANKYHARNNDDDDEEYYYDDYDPNDDGDDYEGSEELEANKYHARDSDKDEGGEEEYYYDDGEAYDDEYYDDSYYDEGDDGDEEKKKRRASSQHCCGIDKDVIKESEHTACRARSSDFSSDIAVDKDQMLTLHNLCRSSVSPPPANMPELKWDDTLACVAKHWANQCPDDHDTYAQRKYPGPHRVFKIGIGQNLGLAWGDVTFAEIVKGWCDEMNNWRHGHGAIDKDPSKPIGHFTQMAWDRTTHVGCGATQCTTDGKRVFVCNYGPAGNVKMNGIDPKKQPYTPA